MVKLPEEARDRLRAAYAEPHRHYHTQQHLEECLAWFGAIGSLAERADEVEIALWFHDAIYDTKRQDNEQRSADWARQEVLLSGNSPDTADRVHSLVLATRHAARPQGRDEEVLVDIDLSNLKASLRGL